MRGGTRFTIVAVALGLAALVLVWKLGSLMIGDPTQPYGPGVRLPRVERGPILDRNGRPLAISTLVWSAHFWKPGVVPGQETETVRLLSEALGMEPARIAERLGTGNAWIKRKMTETETERIRALLAQGKLAGVHLVEEYGRIYPEQESASHVIGFVDIDGVGRDGVELSYDPLLAPTTIGRGVDRVYGNQVFLTIDTAVQWICEGVARKAYRDLAPDSLMLLAMDARNAEILAYVSLPDYDPNEAGAYTDSDRWNRPAKMAYEPGSVFKILSIASFLGRGALRPTDRFEAPGYYTLRDGQRITDLAPYGNIGVSDILKYSSNVGAAKASETIRSTDFYDSMAALGFGRKTGIAFTGEATGILRHPRDWSERSKPTLAFGQELSVTAVQMLSAVTVLTNDGIRLKPQVVSRVLAPDGTPVASYGREPVSTEPVVAASVARMVLDMMETATREGASATRAAVEGVRVSAKSGTAEVGLPTGGYSKDRFVASFLGILPTDDPRLVVYVVLENPRGERPFGGLLAAPLFQEAAEELVSYLGIERSTDTVYRHPGRVVIEAQSQAVIGELMPDLLGLPKRRLLGILTRDDLVVRVVGEGYVVRQSPAPGTEIARGTRITIELE
jgi:cell division protein FtsI (penicillin-binding protein 3)